MDRIHLNEQYPRFPSSTYILRNVKNMLRKYWEIKWTIKAKKPFNDIKKAKTKAPILVSPYFSKDFIFFSFASKHTIDGVLIQENQHNVEHLIAFFNKIWSIHTFVYEVEHGNLASHIPMT